jgi:hypothetical protein
MPHEFSYFQRIKVAYGRVALRRKQLIGACDPSVSDDSAVTVSQGCYPRAGEIQ